MKVSRRRQQDQQRERYNSKQNKRDKIVNLTDIKPVKKRNAVRSGLGDYSANSSNNEPILFCIPENNNKGLEEPEDEYKKYDEMWDGQADQLLINQGATIIDSRITLTDSSGRNRVLVRRDDDYTSDYY